MPDPIIGTLKELSIEYSKKQPKQVDSLTEKTPILDSIKFEPSTHPMWNLAENVNDVTGGGFAEMDAPLEEIAVSTELKKVDLRIMSGKMFCPEDKARAFGGKEKWFAKRTPTAIKSLGMTAETSVIYDNLRQYALDCGNKLNAGGSSNINYCLLAVRWEQGETCGLYSPEGFGQGALINTMALNNGSLYENAAGIAGYGVRLKGYFGIQLLNPKTVAGMFNIDATHLPDEKDVDKLLNMVRKDKNTFLYCHPTVMGMLADVGKGGGFRMGPNDRDVDREIEKWNKVPIVTSWQFLEATEANVSF